MGYMGVDLEGNIQKFWGATERIQAIHRPLYHRIDGYGNSEITLGSPLLGWCDTDLVDKGPACHVQEHMGLLVIESTDPDLGPDPITSVSQNLRYYEFGRSYKLPLLLLNGFWLYLGSGIHSGALSFGS
jgi:hypothetical protein